MSRRRRQGLSPSLFPFLAVLVCTLGTLILLLALVAQSATETAERKAQQEQTAKVKLDAPRSEQIAVSAEAVNLLIEEEQFRLQQLVAFRDQQTNDLETRRDELTHLEDHLQRLKAQLKQLTDEMKLANSPAASAGQADLTDTLLSLQNEIDRQREAIEQLKLNANNHTPRFVIVPHKGPNGTDRRPVYLECTADGVTVWPEGSRISMAQLVGSTSAANPLDAALRVVRHHVMLNYGDTTPPYPLLVVRPDGIDAYAAARKAMLDWDEQFGYELVASGIRLAHSKPDQLLKNQIDEAIRRAAENQRSQATAFDRRGVGGRPLPTLSAASLDRDGRSSGFRGHRDAYADQAPISPYGSSTNTGYGASPRRSTWDPEAQRAARRTGDYSDSSPRGNASRYPSSESDFHDRAREWENAMRAAAAEMRETGSDTEATGSGLAHLGGGSEGDGTQESSLSGNGSKDLEPDRLDSDNLSAETTGQQDNHQNNSQPSLGSGESDELWQQSAAASGRPTEGEPAGSGQNRRGGASESQSSAANSTPPDSDARSAAAAGSSSKMDQQSGAPPLNFDLSPPQQEDLVRREGENWALPESFAGARGNAIVRPIRVECYRDHFVLLPSSRGGATEMFFISNGNVDHAALRLATAVRNRIARWGAALPGAHWQPQLEVDVKPNGETRFYELESLMHQSGVEVLGRASQ